MTFGTSRGRLYDAQKTGRARWEAVVDEWNDEARREFDENCWQPLDALTSDALRAADQLATVFTQVRNECEFTQGF